MHKGGKLSNRMQVIEDILDLLLAVSSSLPEYARSQTSSPLAALTFPLTLPSLSLICCRYGSSTGTIRFEVHKWLDKMFRELLLLAKKGGLSREEQMVGVRGGGGVWREEGV